MIKKALSVAIIAASSFTASYAASIDGQPSTSYDIATHLEQLVDVGCMGIESAQEAMSLVKGMCIWLKITPFPPKVEVKTSLIIEHRVPDLLVQASTGQNDSPIPVMAVFDDTNETIGSTLFSALSPGGNASVSQGLQGGLRTGNRKTQKYGGNHARQMNFYDVQILGNPYLPIYEQLMGSIMDATEIGSYCKSNVTPFQPYYNSLSDMEWRFGIYERLLSMYDTGTGVAVNSRNINNGVSFNLDSIMSGATAGDFSLDDMPTNAGIHWGYIYPRMGIMQQQSQYRSAALAAFRAVDIATNDSGIHTNNGQWPPKSGATNKDFGIAAVNENSLNDHKFQMNFPQMGSKSGCYNFPDKSFDNQLTVTDITATSGPLLDQMNTYIWTLWRTYKCCKKKGQVFVDKVDY